MRKRQQTETKEIKEAPTTDTRQQPQELTVTVSDNAQKLIAQHIRQLKNLNKD